MHFSKRIFSKIRHPFESVFSAHLYGHARNYFLNCFHCFFLTAFRHYPFPQVAWDSYVQFVFTIVLTPCCMTAVSLWLTDEFIKRGGMSVDAFILASKRNAENCMQCFRQHVKSAPPAEKGLQAPLISTRDLVVDKIAYDDHAYG